MKALKTLVIAMGLLIVVGIGLVGYGLTRSKQPHTLLENAPVEVAGGVFASQVAIPPGTKLDQVTATADRVVLRFSGPTGDALVLVDSHTGKVAGTIALTPGSH